MKFHEFCLVLFFKETRKRTKITLLIHIRVVHGFCDLKPDQKIISNQIESEKESMV